MFGALTVPLTLTDAVTRTLCRNPKTRGAWATIKLYAAEVRVARESYLPDLVGTAKELDSDTRTVVNHEPLLNTSAHSTYPQASLSLGWILYDFGERGAQLDAARQLLAAAQANLDLNLQQAFLQAAADYYDAQAAQASLESTREIEELTRKSVAGSHVRVDKGVAPISDELQAQTAHAQAVVNRVKAEADFKSKRGALAIDLGLDPDQSIVLPRSDPDVHTESVFNQSLHDLIEQAKRDHPSVAAAERGVAAAEADERAARAHGYPTISLVGGISRSNEPLAPSLGSPSIPGHVSNKSIGIAINVPLTDPLWKRGHVAQARAQVQVQQEALYGAKQQVAQDVWNSYTALQADTENLTSSEALLESARRAVDSTEHRYEGGVGSILELLSSQAAYASAAQQRIQALSDWRIARLNLGASLGRLNLQSIEESR
jgi:outer membrane protein